MLPQWDRFLHEAVYSSVFAELDSWISASVLLAPAGHAIMIEATGEIDHALG
jgi:hypothetical protein